MKSKLLLAAMLGLGLALAGCSQDAADTAPAAAAGPLGQAQTIYSSNTADGTLALANVTGAPAAYMGKTITIQGQITGWGVTPALTQATTSQVLPLLGDPAHLQAMYPQLDPSRTVQIAGVVGTNNTQIPASVGIIPLQLTNI